MQPFYHDFQFNERVEDTNEEGVLTSTVKDFKESVDWTVETAGDQLLFAASEDISEEVAEALRAKGFHNFAFNVEVGGPGELDFDDEEPEDVTTADIERVLEGNYWPEGLDTRTAYARVHDDCDGDATQVISVSFTPDGDAWVSTLCGRPLRFRNGIGGGMSLRTRNALMLLALAIKKDNEEIPQ